MLASALLHIGREDLVVTCKAWPIALFFALSVSLGAAGSQASPPAIGLSAGPPKGGGGVGERGCGWQQGQRHCRGRGYARQASDYYVRDADKLPFGTSRWWEEMLRENRAGNPGGGGRN
jgi:hypothetical protein